MHWTSAAAVPGPGGEPPTGRWPDVPGYEVVGVVGQGAGGPVWRARPRGGGHAVAVKVVPAGPRADRELALLRSVRHPFVVPLLDAVVLDDGSVALVLALVDGGSLRSLVGARGHLTAGEVVTVLSPLARAMGDLHALGIEHGDVAPGNVLVERCGRPLLADLGTVRVTGTGRDEVFGTAGYVDPVVLAGGRATAASDVYGLGAVGWFALAGSPPPAATSRPPLAELVPGAPPGLVRAIESAVDPDPLRRPAPIDLARAVHASCRSAPLWRSGGGPDAGDLTRRVRRDRWDGTEVPALDRALDWALDGAPDRPPDADLDGTLDPSFAVAGDEDPGSGAREPARPRHRVERRRGRWLVVAAAVLGCALLVGCLALLVPDRWPQPDRTRTPAADGNRPLDAGSSGTPVARATTTAAGVRGAGAAERAGAAEPVGSRPAAARDGPYGDLRSAAVAREVVRQLVSRRAQEVTAVTSEARAVTTLPGSAAALADAAARRSLLTAGLTYRGLRLSAREVSVVAAGADQAVIRVTTEASGYDVVDERGLVRSRVPPRRGSPDLLHLVRTAQGWRVATVTAP